MNDRVYQPEETSTHPPHAVVAAAERLADCDAFLDDDLAAKDLETVLGFLLRTPRGTREAGRA